MDGGDLDSGTSEWNGNMYILIFVFKLKFYLKFKY